MSENDNFKEHESFRLTRLKKNNLNTLSFFVLFIYIFLSRAFSLSKDKLCPHPSSTKDRRDTIDSNSHLIKSCRTREVITAAWQALHRHRMLSPSATEKTTERLDVTDVASFGAASTIADFTWEFKCSNVMLPKLEDLLVVVFVYKSLKKLKYFL